MITPASFYPNALRPGELRPESEREFSAQDARLIGRSEGPRIAVASQRHELGVGAVVGLGIVGAPLQARRTERRHEPFDERTRRRTRALEDVRGDLEVEARVLGECEQRFEAPGT